METVVLQRTAPSQAFLIETVAVAGVLPVFFKLSMNCSMAIESVDAPELASVKDWPAETLALSAKSVVPVELETLIEPVAILTLSRLTRSLLSLDELVTKRTPVAPLESVKD